MFQKNNWDAFRGQKPICGTCDFNGWIKEQSLPRVLEDCCRSTLKNSFLCTFSNDFLSKVEWESSDSEDSVDDELEEGDSSEPEENVDDEQEDEGEESSDEEESTDNEKEEEQE